MMESSPQLPKPNVDSDFYLIPAETPEDIFNKLIHVVTKRIPERFGFDPVADIQVLTPMNRGGVGVRSLNIELQNRLNNNSTQQITRFGVTFAPGDKVIQMVNNYDKDVYNGDIGLIQFIDNEESLLNIEFDGRAVQYEFNELDEIQLAYAVSIHKSTRLRISCHRHTTCHATLYAAGTQSDLYRNYPWQTVGGDDCPNQSLGNGCQNPEIETPPHAAGSSNTISTGVTISCRQR